MTLLIEIIYKDNGRTDVLFIQGINGILADEMGLGKVLKITIWFIAPSNIITIWLNASFYIPDCTIHRLDGSSGRNI